MVWRVGVYELRDASRMCVCVVQVLLHDCVHLFCSLEDI